MIQRLFRKMRLISSDASIKSFHQLERSSPLYSQLAVKCGECREQLRPVYEGYVRDVSSANMAASLELGALLLALCRINRWHRLLDLGSGFSSYVFRLYAKENPGVVVYSVDDDPVWLKRTASFLSEHQLSTERLLWLDDFLRESTQPFDCILHDLNFVEVRIHHVEDVLSRLATDGMAIFDDVHKTDYRIELLRKLAPLPGKTFSLRPVTADSFGRYALTFISSRR